MLRRARFRPVNTPDSRVCGYKTASGRPQWPNRDPIEEKGGANLYAINRNDTVGRIDALGLATCDSCGEDVTAALNTTLSNIGSTFASWDDTKKRQACTSIIGEGPSPVKSAWDILELGYFREALVPFKKQKLTGGSGKCKYTVTVGGSCFYATQVNFAMWGYMNKLCFREFPFEPAESPLGFKWTSEFARNLVFGWKYSEYGQTPFNAYVQQAVAFTDYGYSGDASKFKGKGLKCSASNQTYSEAFDWAWEPGKKREW